MPDVTSAEKWVTCWTGSVQGPTRSATRRPSPICAFVFPSAEIGARDQSFRLIVRPGLWGPQLRLRFSNALGTRPVTFDGVHVGLQQGAATLVPGTNQPVSFAGGRATTVAPGSSVWSDAVPLPFVDDPASPRAAGRRLAVSFPHRRRQRPDDLARQGADHLVSLTAPGAGATGAAEDEREFPFTTASWYFLSTRST